MIKGIIGAVIGDIAGSSRESKPVSRKTFKMFTKESSVTDDTALTMAVAEWMLDRKGVDVGKSLIKWATEYPHAGYGSSFKRFLANGSHLTPGSTHNGAVMRVSPVGFLASSLEECLELAAQSALPSHDSPQAIAGAKAAAAAIYLARTGSSKEEIRDYLEAEFVYNLHRSYDEVREEVRHARATRETDYEASHERIVGAEPAVQALIYIPSDMLEVINRVDGTSWKPSKLIPPKSSRWSIHDVIICGCNAEETEGERAFHLTRPSRFRRHHNQGYPIHISGLEMEKTLDQIWVLRSKCEDYKHIRWHLHDIGIESGVFSADRFRELFGWALELDNVLVTPTLLNI